jgi:hypothetical protein
VRASRPGNSPLHPYKGEQIQGMFGGGQFGGTNLVAPLEICVLPADVDAARELLRTSVPGATEGPAA